MSFEKVWYALLVAIPTIGWIVWYQKDAQKIKHGFIVIGIAELAVVIIGTLIVRLTRIK